MSSGWELLQRVFTADTIMTPWSEVTTVGADELQANSPVVLIAQKRKYSWLPIVDGGHVTGIFELHSHQRHSLTPDWLISHDTPIPDLIELFAVFGKRFFLAMYRQDIVGIVSLADLNKMPVRIYLFNLLADLETALASAIQAHFAGDDKAVLDLLDPNDIAEEIVQMSPAMANEDLDLGELQRLYLKSLVSVLRQTPALHQAIGFSSPTQVGRTLNGLVDLRNTVAHSVRPLLCAHSDINRLVRRIQRAKEVLSWLDRYADSRGDVHLPLRHSVATYPTERHGLD